MVTSATIDISKYTSTADTSNAKSHNDKSSDFNDIFNTVNKAFTPEKSSTSNASDTKSAKSTEEKTKKTNSSDNSDKKIDDSNKKTEDKKVDDKPKDKEVNEKTTDTDTKNKTTETDEPKKTEDSSDTKDTETSNEVQPTADKTVLDTQPTVITNNIIEALENAVSAIATPAEGSNTADNSSVTATNEQPTQGIAAGVATDLSKITQNLTNNITNQVANNKVSTQIQQPASSQIKQQGPQAQDLKQEAPQAAATDTSNQIKVDAEAVVPVVIAANVNIKTETNTTTKENTNDASKTAITQDMLDKTNAKVVSVDTNSSNSNNNLLNKQNAQEQAIKFSLESNSKPESASKSIANTELPGVTDVTSQLGFTKTLDGVQPQATKEISHSDILNQINKQLDVLKEDTTSKVTIILKPENLGKISVELVNGKEGLTAKMTTDNAQVKELLDKSLNSLKDNLGNQGVSVNNVSVKLNETQKQDNMFSFNEQTNQQQQQNSQNPKQAEGNESSFDKEINSATEAEAELAEASATPTGTESSISISSNLGKVDYKV